MRTTILNFNELNTEKITYLRHIRNNSSNDNERKQMKKILLKAIDEALTEKQRICIIEHYLNEKKEKDIAFELGVNPSTISRHISSAKRKLQRIAAYYTM